jgi:hypothetical protein
MNQGIHRAGRGLPITDHQVMAMSSVAHIRALIVRKESIKKSGIPSKNHLRLSRKGAGVCTDDVQCAKRQRLRLRVKQSLISIRATYSRER